MQAVHQALQAGRRIRQKASDDAGGASQQPWPRDLVMQAVQHVQPNATDDA